MSLENLPLKERLKEIVQTKQIIKEEILEHQEGIKCKRKSKTMGTDNRLLFL